MATIKFVHSEDRRFVSAQERAKTEPKIAEFLKLYPPGEYQGETFYHHQGSEEEPQLFEVKLPPGTKIDSHAHYSDEIIFVTEGEAHFGKQVYGVGSSVYVPKMTLYAFQAGPEGLTFLNFRTNRTTGVITKEEFMAMRNQNQNDRASA